MLHSIMCNDPSRWPAGAANSHSDGLLHNAAGCLSDGRVPVLAKPTPKYALDTAEDPNGKVRHRFGKKLPCNLEPKRCTL
jgi:hypothetical protein